MTHTSIVTDSGNTPAGRHSTELVPQRASTEELTLCPSCGRQTATVGHGTCSECWQAKTPDGAPALRPVEPKTSPHLGSIDNVPDWVWLALAAALIGGLLKGFTAL